MTDLEELEKAHQLLQEGIITQTDFENIKNETLAPKPSYEKSHVCAGLLALFLGGVGAHKFYLGYINEALILLGIDIAAFIMMFFIPGLAGLILFVVGIICIAEAIIYLTTTDDKFNKTYVENTKHWF